MSINAATLEREAIADVAFQMREAGYDIQIEPHADRLPFDLGGYRPDIVGRKGNGGVIVEVKTSESRVAIDDYVRVADLVKGHAAWRFLLVPANQLREQTFSELLGLSSIDQLRRRAAVAKQLLAGDNPAAAFITAWSAVEGVLRRIAAADAAPASALPTGSLVKQLYSLGLLSRARMKLLDELQPARNALVHGFGEEHAVSGAAQVIGLLEEMLREERLVGSPTS